MSETLCGVRQLQSPNVIKKTVKLKWADYFRRIHDELWVEISTAWASIGRRRTQTSRRHLTRCTAVAVVANDGG